MRPFPEGPKMPLAWSVVCPEDPKDSSPKGCLWHWRIPLENRINMIYKMNKIFTPLISSQRSQGLLPTPPRRDPFGKGPKDSFPKESFGLEDAFGMEVDLRIGIIPNSLIYWLSNFVNRSKCFFQCLKLFKDEMTALLFISMVVWSLSTLKISNCRFFAIVLPLSQDLINVDTIKSIKINFKSFMCL